MNENYFIFKNWLDNCLKQNPIDEKIKAIYFGLFESNKRVKLYISGSIYFNIEDSDWACNNDYVPTKRYCPDIPMINELFETKEEVFVRVDKIYNVIEVFVNEYILDKSEYFKDKKIAVGFDDGDLKIIK